MKNISNKSQPWKAPVHVWIRDLYTAMQEKAARKKGQQTGGAGGNRTH